MSEPRRPPWAWLAPSAVLLVALAVWGALRYPHLPDRIPRHIGPGGVDAWTGTSFWSAFLPVYLYAGLTALIAGCAVWTVRTTPLEEMPRPADRWAAAAGALRNRPATAASARRLAAAVLQTNALLGLVFALMAWSLWHVPETSDVPGWFLPAVVALCLLTAVPPLVAAWRNAGEARAVQRR